jgi:predicted membrane protein
MEAGFLQLLSVLLSLPAHIVHADVAPPVSVFALLGGAVIGLGLLVVITVVVSIVVIRAIKKKNTPK